jgi:hypothetical protein
MTAVSSIEIWEQKFFRSTSSINLYYSGSEFLDATKRYCSHAQIAIDLKKPALNYLYYITNGHPKLVPSFLALVDEISREAVGQTQNQSSRRQMNFNDVEEIMKNDQTVFGRGEIGYQMCGPPPSSQNDRSSALALFRDLLLEGKVLYSRTVYGNVIDMCYSSGLLIMKDDSPNEFLVFPSPLHRR